MRQFLKYKKPFLINSQLYEDINDKEDAKDLDLQADMITPLFSDSEPEEVVKE